MLQQNLTDSKILNPKQAAIALSVNRRTLDNWRSLGRGPAYVKISARKIAYLREDIDQFIAQRRVIPVNN